LGLPVPPSTPHAISVSLPTWRDNVAYEEGDPRVANAMVTGYPRFFIHRSIQRLAAFCEQRFALLGEKCMLFSSRTIAVECRSFITRRAREDEKWQISCNGPQDFTTRAVHFLITSEDAIVLVSSAPVDLHIVIFPASAFPLAKQFWQHSGLGISSRLADHCLAILETNKARSTPPLSPKFANNHYGARNFYGSKPAAIFHAIETTPSDLPLDQATYVEERYGRNLPLSYGAAAKRALRRRIAGVVRNDGPQMELERSADNVPADDNTDANHPLQPSSRVSSLTEEDVFLYPCGMAAIWSAHQLALRSWSTVHKDQPVPKSVMFGFPYTDTLKCLEKWGPGCHFLGHGTDADIEELERMLENQVHETDDNTTPSVLALFTEFPSNPLLRSADLGRLRGLADKYGFLIVVDDTIGTFANVDVMSHTENGKTRPLADIVVSSLSKIFSGDANVMAGSLVLNPASRHYSRLKKTLASTYEDSFFDEDAIYLERNSRDFRARIHRVDHNTQALCTYLVKQKISADVTGRNKAIKEVWYPRYTTPERYEACRVKDGCYGSVFSLTFSSLAVSRAFFDAMRCYKGPSLGTNFTLASPFAVLAHFKELDWAAQYGVEEGLVRVSVGMEDTDQLLADFEHALECAEEV
ncbi:PLP-dependent transferase, partial [Fistulina hepatica ATCC 64428]